MAHRDVVEFPTRANSFRSVLERLRRTGWLQVGVCHLLFVALVYSSVKSIAERLERWPFSHYPMYAGMHTGQYTTLRLYAVTPQGKEIDFNKRAYLDPLDAGRIREALRAIQYNDESGTKVPEALKFVAKHYYERRRNLRKEWPNIVALRWYRVRYQMKPGAPNRNKPTERQLIMETPIVCDSAASEPVH